MAEGARVSLCLIHMSNKCDLHSATLMRTDREDK
jgi:hypothetical protein